MIFQRDVSDDLKVPGRNEVVRTDLRKPETLAPAVQGIDAIVNFAGVLFKAHPERLLPKTNTGYFENLVDTATLYSVRKIILIRFPHVEGPTTFENPARARLDGAPISVHAKTRLEEEKYLFASKRLNPREPRQARLKKLEPKIPFEKLFNNLIKTSPQTM